MPVSPSTLGVVHSSIGLNLLMFRTTVFGHWDCTGQLTCTPPLIDASHFVPTPNFGWSRVPNLNQIASRVLTHNVQNSSMSEGILHAANFHILDVEPMTTLRPDGHRFSMNDCLHYFLPGPPDWWNHLMTALFVSKEEGQVSSAANISQ